MIVNAIALAVLGLIFGSFVNALVWRVHEQENPRKAKNKDLSITKGRSMCSKCGHELAVRDLVPVFSWLALHGRCRYCHKPIEDSPIIEVKCALVFVVSYLFWPVSLSETGQLLLFGTWLLAVVGLSAMAVYDLRWMLLPNRILYPTFLVAAIGRLGYLIFYDYHPAYDFWQLVLSIIVASGVFLFIFIISKGKWIGFGDVRLGLVTGTLLATPAKSFLMIFLASVLGMVVVLPALAKGQKNGSTQLPYGPFLIAASLIVMLFGDSIINWYQHLII